MDKITTSKIEGDVTLVQINSNGEEIANTGYVINANTFNKFFAKRTMKPEGIADPKDAKYKVKKNILNKSIKK